ncbi:transketolase family protein [Actinocrispum wychmicini]|uniref:Transketolase n=1 Tax=Actinocrispum wychmicini TaxID=1213861 RepID=A0A4R2JA22_9PSEU|nr:transketolase C-terminal domain-containing protein [Actinocrispum wychmicini]TCO55604.1 transketolase [Actinocrispum wychmicini]
MTAPRDAYRAALAELAARDERIWCCDSDMGGLEDGFGRQFPRRYVDLGIAEANMMSVAAGLAASGKIPFVNTMASFACLRAGEQVKIDIAYNALPVHIAASHAGLSGGHFGPTHQSLEDIAVMRALPNMTVIVPSDAAMIAQAVAVQAGLPGPSYLRLGRKATPDVHPPGARFVLGRAARLRAGTDVTLVACGPHPVLAALAAHEQLVASGVSARVLDVSTLKPFDVESIVDASIETGGLVTVEEHSVIGGLGSAVAEVLAEHAPARLRRIGMPDRFCAQVGTPEHLLDTYGITGKAVAEAALELLADRPSEELIPS